MFENIHNNIRQILKSYAINGNQFVTDNTQLRQLENMRLTITAQEVGGWGKKILQCFKCPVKLQMLYGLLDYFEACTYICLEISPRNWVGAVSL